MGEERGLEDRKREKERELWSQIEGGERAMMRERKRVMGEERIVGEREREREREREMEEDKGR